MIAPVLVFALTYALVSGIRIPRLDIDRTSAAFIGAVAMVLTGAIPSREAFAAINWDTIALLLGMMVLTVYLVEARLFRWLAWQTVARAGGARRLLGAIVLVAGTLSALLVNDTVCVMFTPLVVAVVDEAGLPALPYLLALSTASNIGGVVTYTGNPQNMIVGTHATISFGGYLARMLPVGVLGLAADWALLAWMFRRELPPRGTPLPAPSGEVPRLDGRVLLRALAVLGLVVAGFLAHLPLAGTALAGAAVLLLVGGKPTRPMIARVDFGLLLFFSSLFVVVAGVGRSGALEHAYAWVVPRLGHAPGEQLVRLTLATEVGSNLFSNVPFVLLAVDLVPRLADPSHAWVALAMASTLAGNLTIFGSVANLIVLELAGPHGHPGFWRFLRHGAVVTAATTAIGLAVLLVERALGF